MMWPKLKRDYIGMRIRICEEVSNKSLCLSVGTEATITYWYRGATLKTDPCPHCGVGVYITKVPQHCMEPVSLPNVQLSGKERQV